MTHDPTVRDPQRFLHPERRRSLAAYQAYGEMMKVAKELVGHRKHVGCLEDLCKILIGKWVLVPVLVINQIDLLGCCSIYIIIQAGMLAGVTMNGGTLARLGYYDYIPSWIPSGKQEAATLWWMVYLSTLMIPVCWIKSPRVLSKAASVGLIASFVILFSVVIGCSWIIHDSGHNLHLTKWIDPDHLSGTGVVFTYAFAIAVLGPCLYNDLEKKQDFKKVVYSSHAIACAVFSCVCGVGYLAFGDGVKKDVSLSMTSQPMTQLIVAVY